MRILGGLFLVALVGCVADESEPMDIEDGAGGKGDQSDATPSYRYSGRFRLFNGIISQEAELSGSFEMARPQTPLVETTIHNVSYELALAADAYHSAYTLRSTPDRDRSWADWRDTGLEVFIEQVTELSADAERSVFRSNGGKVVFKFYPFCDGQVRGCEPGALSGFDYYGSPSNPYPTMQLDSIGPFTLVAE